MNLIVPVAAFILVAGGAIAQQKKEAKRVAPMATTKLQLVQCALKVSGMTCNACTDLVEQGLLKLSGVKAAKVDWKTGDVQVEYDAKKTAPEKIVSAFNQANAAFRAELPKRKTN